MPEYACRGCGAREAELHKEGCHLEYCPVCRERARTCRCEPNEVERRPRVPYGNEEVIARDPQISGMGLTLLLLGTALIAAAMLVFLP